MRVLHARQQLLRRELSNVYGMGVPVSQHSDAAISAAIIAIATVAAAAVGARASQPASSDLDRHASNRDDAGHGAFPSAYGASLFVDSK